MRNFKSFFLGKIRKYYQFVVSRIYTKGWFSNAYIFKKKKKTKKKKKKKKKKKQQQQQKDNNNKKVHLTSWR